MIFLINLFQTGKHSLIMNYKLRILNFCCNTERSEVSKILLILFLLISVTSFAQEVNFDKYFINKSMRVDYSHVGNSENESIYLKEIRQEQFWGGSQVNLIDTFMYGNFMVKIYDKATKKLIYSRGSDNLFKEWQTIPEAKEISKSFYEVATFPYPKEKIIFNIDRRDRKGGYFNLFYLEIDPKDVSIKKEKACNYNTFEILKNGDSKNKVDIAFIFDGYTKDETEKLHKDAKRFAEYLFSYSPFTENKDKFNICGVEVISNESGTDMPTIDVWKNTAINSNFNTFSSERYLTTSDIKSLRDAASLVPYDQIFLLVNTAKYGGGGIYNFWSITSVDDPASKFVFLHEFGHGFGGLADEYVDYGLSDEFYPKGVEPWEPNITNLVDFDKKWKNLIDKDTPQPTPATTEYAKTIGLFEGAGYMEKGFYRPYRKCEMQTLMVGYCPICEHSIQQMIDFYTK